MLLYSGKQLNCLKKYCVKLSYTDNLNKEILTKAEGCNLINYIPSLVKRNDVANIITELNDFKHTVYIKLDKQDSSKDLLNCLNYKAFKYIFIENINLFKDIGEAVNKIADRFKTNLVVCTSYRPYLTNFLTFKQFNLNLILEEDFNKLNNYNTNLLNFKVIDLNTYLHNTVGKNYDLNKLEAVLKIIAINYDILNIYKQINRNGILKTLDTFRINELIDSLIKAGILIEIDNTANNKKQIFITQSEVAVANSCNIDIYKKLFNTKELNNIENITTYRHNRRVSIKEVI